jgi:hypothetical protein
MPRLLKQNKRLTFCISIILHHCIPVSCILVARYLLRLSTLEACLEDLIANFLLRYQPLEDRGYNGHVPIKFTIKPKAPTNAGVARWQSEFCHVFSLLYHRYLIECLDLEFDDVDETDKGLDNIADGQLYRMRRGASFGPSHAPSGRGGHSSNNVNRGGRSGSGFPSRGSPARGGRGGRAASSDDARRDNLSSRYTFHSATIAHAG